MIIVTRYLSKSSLPFAVQGLQHFLITSLCAGIGSLRQPLPNFCSRSEDLQSFSWIFPLPEMISYRGTASFVFSPASENHHPSSVMLGVMQWFLKMLHHWGFLGSALFRRRNISCSGPSRLSPEPGPKTHLCCYSSGCMEVEEKLNTIGGQMNLHHLLSCGNWIFYWPFAKNKQN